MSEKKYTLENINEIMKSMLEDSKSMAIWAELAISNEITATELFKRLSIKKSVLYARLNKLTQKGVLTTRMIIKDTQKKKRVPETIYSLNSNFLSKYTDLISSLENQAAHIRDYRLFHLYLVNSLLSREIRLLSKKTNEEVAKTIKEGQYYGKLASLTESEHDFLQTELRSIYQIMDDQQKREYNELKRNNMFEEDIIYYSGFLKIR